MNHPVLPLQNSSPCILSLPFFSVGIFGQAASVASNKCVKCLAAPMAAELHHGQHGEFFHFPWVG